MSEIIDFVDKCINRAVKDGASEIHLEKYNEHARMQFRLDGVLQDQKDSEKVLFENYAGIVTRIKIFARLDILELTLPQDGLFNMKVGDKEVDFRVSILPASEDEKVVIKILVT